MKYQTREEHDATVVTFEGDVDLQSSPDARKVLLEMVGKGQPIMVDLSEVGYIDSSGVASLVESFQAARKSFSLDFAAARSLSAFSNLINELS